MKTFFIMIVMVILAASSVYADVFQFIDRSSNSYLISYAVYISNQRYGYTDGYGRIRIDRQNGNYTVTLKKRNRPDRIIQISIDGSNTLKVISIP